MRPRLPLLFARTSHCWVPMRAGYNPGHEKGPPGQPTRRPTSRASMRCGSPGTRAGRPRLGSVALVCGVFASAGLRLSPSAGAPAVTGRYAIVCAGRPARFSRTATDAEVYQPRGPVSIIDDETRAAAVTVRDGGPRLAPLPRLRVCRGVRRTPARAGGRPYATLSARAAGRSRRTPGDMVEATVTLLTYWPLAPAGLARWMASIEDARFCISA